MTLFFIDCIPRHKMKQVYNFKVNVQDKNLKVGGAVMCIHGYDNTSKMGSKWGAAEFTYTDCMDWGVIGMR